MSNYRKLTVLRSEDPGEMERFNDIVGQMEKDLGTYEEITHISPGACFDCWTRKEEMYGDFLVMGSAGEGHGKRFVDYARDWDMDIYNEA